MPDLGSGCASGNDLHTLAGPCGPTTPRRAACVLDHGDRLPPGLSADIPATDPCETDACDARTDPSPGRSTNLYSWRGPTEHVSPLAGARRVVTGPVHRPRERRYTDDEVALILRRAAEFGGETGPPRSEGLSLAEIQQVAREVGIDPATVARAASALSARKRDRLTAIIGGPMRYRLEATVPGKAADANLGRILQSIRHAAGRQGRATQVLDSVEWRTSSEREGSQLFVTVTTGDDGTTIEVTGDRQSTAALLYLVPGVAGMIVSLIVSASLEAGWAAGGMIAAGVLGGVFLLSRTIWSHTGRTFARKLEDIRDAAVQTVERTADEGSEPSARGGSVAR